MLPLVIGAGIGLLVIGAPLCAPIPAMTPAERTTITSATEREDFSRAVVRTGRSPCTALLRRRRRRRVRQMDRHQDDRAVDLLEPVRGLFRHHHPVALGDLARR